MKKILYLLIAVLFFSSCGVRYKYVPYFTDLPKESIIEEKITNQTILRVQSNDILAITVSSSSPSPEAAAAAAMFNQGNTSSVQGDNNPNLVNAMNGFAVDNQGNIQIPLIGSVQVMGLTLAEVRTLIQDKLSVNYLKNPIVNIRLANFRISVMGEVAKPGVYPINNEKVTITEAISLAGDLKITALRKDVLLIREIDGERKFVHFDLQSKELFSSPYYYLKNNDVLYITPDKTAYSSVDNSYRNVSIIISVISILSIFISRL